MYMFSAKPIIFIGKKNSEIAKEIEKAKCGIIIENRRSKFIRDGFQNCLNITQEKKEKMGNSGYAFAKKNYSYEIAMKKLEHILKLI